MYSVELGYQPLAARMTFAPSEATRHKRRRTNMIDPPLQFPNSAAAWLAATAESEIDRAALYGGTMALFMALREENAG